MTYYWLLCFLTTTKHWAHYKPTSAPVTLRMRNKTLRHDSSRTQADTTRYRFRGDATCDCIMQMRSLQSMIQTLDSNPLHRWLTLACDVFLFCRSTQSVPLRPLEVSTRVARTSIATIERPWLIVADPGALQLANPALLRQLLLPGGGETVRPIRPWTSRASARHRRKPAKRRNVDILLPVAAK